MLAVFSRKKPLYRKKSYGLGLVAFKLLALLWLGLVMGALELMELRYGNSFGLLLFGGGLLPPAVFFVWNERRAARLKKRDQEAAAEAIRKPLRSVRQSDGSLVDFDPHYPHVHLNGAMARALDPRRRLMRMIGHWTRLTRKGDRSMKPGQPAVIS